MNPFFEFLNTRLGKLITVFIFLIGAFSPVFWIGSDRFFVLLIGMAVLIFVREKYKKDKNDGGGSNQYLNQII